MVMVPLCCKNDGDDVGQGYYDANSLADDPELVFHEVLLTIEKASNFPFPVCKLYYDPFIALQNYLCCVF